jgi:hypothetical protein
LTLGHFIASTDLSSTILIFQISAFTIWN